METSGLLAGVAIPLGFICAYCLVSAVSGVVLRSRRRMAGMSGGLTPDWDERILQFGIPHINSLSNFLLENRRIRQVVGRFSLALRAKGVRCESMAVLSCLLVVVVLVVFLGTILGSSPVFGAAAAACVLLGCSFASSRIVEEQRDALRDAMPDVLRSMRSCFRGGYSLVQTFERLADENVGALGEGFARAAGELKTGRTIPETLDSLRRGPDVPELAFVVVALEIQHRTGGAMEHVLRSAGDSVDSELKLRRSLRVQTAQARLSARLVTAMPFVLIAVFSLMTEDFLAPFFSSPLGLAVLCVALMLQVAGVLCVRRLLDVGEA